MTSSTVTDFFSSVGWGGDFFSGSKGSFSVCESAACALRNSLKPLPIARPTSGNFEGPKTINPTIKIIMNSPALIPNIKITPKFFRCHYIMCKALFKYFSEKIVVFCAKKIQPFDGILAVSC